MYFECNDDFKWHEIIKKVIVPFRFCKDCINFDQAPVAADETYRCRNEFICIQTASMLFEALPLEVDVDGHKCIYSLQVERKYDE